MGFELLDKRSVQVINIDICISPMRVKGKKLVSEQGQTNAGIFASWKSRYDITI